MAEEPKKRRFKNLPVIIGIVLLTVPNGVAWYWGNLSILTLSYVVYVMPDTHDVDSPWVVSLYIVFRAIGLIAYDFSRKYVRRNYVMIVGMIISDVSILLCYFAVQYSLPLINFALGVCVGLGTGFLYGISFRMAVDISDGNVGFLTSLIQGSLAAGAIVINEFVTLYANPENISPSFKRGFSLYFTELEILEKVPDTFIFIGGFGAVVHVLSFILINQKLELPGDAEKVQKADGIPLEEAKGQSNYDSMAERDGANGEASTSQEKTLAITNGDSIREDASEILDDMAASSKKGESSKLVNGNGTKKSSSQSDLDKITSEGESSGAGVEGTQEGDGANQVVVDEVIPDESTTNGWKANFTPKQLFRTFTFYAIWYAFFVADLPKLMLSNYYKAFGQLWIKDDHYLTDLGTVIVMANTWLRCIWGIFFDKLRLKNLLALIFIPFILFNTWYFFTYKKNEWIYFFCTIAFGSLTGALYSVFPALLATVFGKKHFSSNLAILMSAPIVFNLIGPVWIKALLTTFGWFGAFSTTAVINVISFALLLNFIPNHF